MWTPPASAEISSTLVEKKPRSCVQILKELARLVRLRTGKNARPSSRAPSIFDSAEKAKLESIIKQKFGADISTEFRVTPALIGGVRIKLGSDVWDGSISARLTALQKAI